ncbi:MAG TPA: pilus assembly protein TadG-related protein [Rhodoblastus sp.]|nr:pilus assembly protein TadG-related protein [Rhodoblastus sp.]
MKRAAFSIQRLAADQRGSVTIIGAFLIAALIAFVSLVGEYGMGLERQNNNQRVADLAAIAAANYYMSNSSSLDQTTLQNGAKAIAENVATLNGVTLTTSDITFPTDTTTNTLHVAVHVSTSAPLFLANLVGGSASLAASASSSAQIGTQTPQTAACITSLSANTNVTMSGGTVLNAPNCGIASNATVALTGGASLTASSVSYNTSSPSHPSGTTWNVNTVKKASTTDPLASNSGVIAAQAEVVTASALTRPTAPAAQAVVGPTNTGGTNVSFSLGWSPTTTQTSGPCTARYASSAWTITCPAGGTYNFTTFSIPGSMGATFATTGSGTTTFNFPNAVSASYSTWTFAPANYNFLGGLSISGGTETFQSDGATHSIYVSCNSSTNSCSSSTTGLNLNSPNITFAGPVNLYVNGPMTVASGTIAFAGAGSLTVTSNMTFSGGPTASFTGVNNLYVGGVFSTAGSARVSFQGGGTGAYTFVNGLTHNASNPLSFQGSGTYSIGPTAACNNTNYSICVTNSGVLNFSGTDTFSISNGIYVSGGDTLIMGSGSNNSFNVGSTGTTSTLGTALYMGGGAKVTFADATGSGVFQIAGNINNQAGGGSCFFVGAAPIHDIDGWFSTAGGTTLGSGLYALNGYLAFGQNSGGAVNCTNPLTGVSKTVGLYGISVTIAYNASTTAIGGNCSGAGLCFSAGFSNVVMTAPTSGTYANLLFVGPPASNSASAIFSGGAGAEMSGAFYMPGGAFSMLGGASINYQGVDLTFLGSSACLQIVANYVSLTGGTTAATTCITASSSTASSTSNVRLKLVQ